MIDEIEFGLGLTISHLWLCIIAIAIPVAALSGLRLIAIERRDRIQRLRLDVFRSTVPVAPDAGRSQSLADYVGNLLSPIVGVVEQQRLRKLLMAAGLRDHSVTSFVALKGTTAFVLISLVILCQPRPLIILIAAVCMAFLGGWRLPDLVLRSLVKRRRLGLEHGMPDALDLLVICAEAGLSLNQGVDEISRQLRLSNKDIADEFAITAAEMQVLSDFGQALDNLVERTELKNLASLIATLKQSLKFGTPLAESLRMIAAEMRAERNARMEERAARLPVLMAVPMAMFILPSVMLVIGTPVALRLVDTFKTLHFGAP